MLEQMSAVKEGEAMAVGREVRWDPVENDRDVVLVQVVDEVHEILRRAVTRRGSEVTRGLIAPGTIERMLHDREQFDVCESELIYVVGEAGRDLAISKRTVVLFGDAHPGAEVNFVDGHWCVQRVGGCALFEKGSVAPGVAEIPDYGSGARRFFGEQSYWVSFLSPGGVMRGVEMELVQRALVDTGDKTFPDSRRAASLELMRLRVPTIEAADHRHAAGIGSPDAEDSALGAPGFHQVRAH